MTVLVDTSTWVEFLRGTGSAHNRWIRDAIRAGTPLGWTEPILYELTAGARGRRRGEELRALLLRGPLLAVQGMQDWEDAAHLYRSARAKGLTVRSSMDCLIAVVALRTGSRLLAVDRDFDALAQVSGLELAQPRE